MSRDDRHELPLQKLESASSETGALSSDSRLPVGIRGPASKIQTGNGADNAAPALVHLQETRGASTSMCRRIGVLNYSSQLRGQTCIAARAPQQFEHSSNHPGRRICMVLPSWCTRQSSCTNGTVTKCTRLPAVCNTSYRRAESRPRDTLGAVATVSFVGLHRTPLPSHDVVTTVRGVRRPSRDLTASHPGRRTANSSSCSCRGHCMRLSTLLLTLQMHRR